MRRLADLVVFLALEGCGGVSIISLPKFPSKAVAAVAAPPVGVKDCPADNEGWGRSKVAKDWCSC